MNRILSVVAVLAIALTAAAEQPWTREPQGFRGVAFGMSRLEAGAVMRNGFDGPAFARAWRCTSKTLEDRTLEPLVRAELEARELVAGTCTVFAHMGRVDTEQQFTFRGDRFILVRITFPSLAFDDVLAQLVAQYGPPTSQRIDQVETLAGGTLSNDAASWNGPHAVMEAQRYFTTVDRGFVVISIAPR